MAQAGVGEGTAMHLRGLHGVVQHWRHLWGATALVIAASAQAQSGACEQLKRSLGERLPGDPRGYSLEVVPSGTPLPRGGKFIGSCEGGAKKILYRRGVAAEPTPGRGVPAASTAASNPVPRLADTASAPVPTVRPDEPAAGTQVMQEAEPARPAPWWQQAAHFVARHWPWFLALVMVPIAWIAWAWWAHHRAYDAAGLPRGPRL